MVLLLLEMKAELESITNLVPKGGSDGSEYTFFFKVLIFRVGLFDRRSCD